MIHHLSTVVFALQQCLDFTFCAAFPPSLRDSKPVYRVCIPTTPHVSMPRSLGRGPHGRAYLSDGVTDMTVWCSMLVPVLESQNALSLHLPAYLTVAG